MIATIIGSIGLVALVAAAFVGDAVFSYLFLRANPRKKVKLDKAVDKIEGGNDGPFQGC